MSPILIDLLRGLLGVAGLLAIALACSENRRAIDWRIVGGGLSLQLLLGLLFLVVPGGAAVFGLLADFFVAVTGFTREGTEFLFGKVLGNPAELEKRFGAGFGLVFAFHVLPTIIFFSALCSVLYYLGVLQRVVWAFAWVTQRFMRLSGAESLATAAEIFLGQTESPLLIKPYVSRLTRSELFALMTGGMATIAGGVLVAYIQILGGTDPAQQAAFARVLLCASFMAAPAGLVIAKILVPQTLAIDENLFVPKEKLGANFLDALANGTSEGLKLALNVGAMLIAFIAFAAMINAGLSRLHPDLSLDSIFGWLFAPVAWLIGVESNDVLGIGRLLGKKLVFNEFVAYLDLGLMKSEGTLSAKSVFLATFALCGFANFASIGIQLGGTGNLAPEQRPTMAALGFRALLGGTLATLLTAALAGLLYPWSR
ncbi:MAG: NupC/NupG family nucleoside CNT transporter [Verrucomicrobiales bacterium]